MMIKLASLYVLWYHTTLNGNISVGIHICYVNIQTSYSYSGNPIKDTPKNEDGSYDQEIMHGPGKCMCAKLHVK